MWLILLKQPGDPSICQWILFGLYPRQMDSGNGCQGVGLVELEFATKGSQDLGCVGAGCVCEQSLVRGSPWSLVFRPCLPPPWCSPFDGAEMEQDSGDGRKL